MSKAALPVPPPRPRFSIGVRRFAKDVATSHKAYHLVFYLLLLAGLYGVYVFGLELSSSSRSRRPSSSFFRSLHTTLYAPGPPPSSQGGEGNDPSTSLHPASLTSSSSSSSGGTLSQPSTTAPAPEKRGTLGDPNPIHLVYTLCGNPNEVEKDHYGLLSIKSLLMAKEHTAGSGRHYIFHILHNIDDEELFNTTRLNWEVYRALEREVGAGLVTYHTYHIRELDEATGVALGGSDPNLAVPHHIFKNCAATRIKLPFLLGGKVERVLYLDWDTVVTCDLTRLWDHWEGFNAAQLLGMASADPSGVSDRDVYRMWNMPRHPTFGAVNSGVMMMHIGRMHEEGKRGKALQFWNAISAIIRSKVNVTGTPQDYWDLTRAFVLGDQDILNALFAPRSVNASWGHPEWLYLIPPQYNFCIDPPFPEEIEAWDVERKPLKSYKRRPAPCVHHFCGNRLMSNDRDKEWLDVKDPHQGLFMYIKHWKLEKHEPPPGMRPPIDGNDPSTWH